MPLFSANTGWQYGDDSATQTVFTIENGPASRVDVYIKRLVLQIDVLVALASVMPIIKTSRCTNVVGGSQLSKGKYSSTGAGSDSNVKVRAGVFEAADLECTQGTVVWQQFAPRTHTAVEQQIGQDCAMLPDLVSSTDFVLRPGEAVCCTVVSPNAASNPAVSNNWFVAATWEETPINTFPISGQVTLSSSPVAGALVTVIEADDESMTDARLVEVVTTDGSGNWESSIRTGCVGAAMVQYKSGATYYTAPGSPYLE